MGPIHKAVVSYSTLVCGGSDHTQIIVSDNTADALWDRWGSSLAG